VGLHRLPEVGFVNPAQAVGAEDLEQPRRGLPGVPVGLGELQRLEVMVQGAGGVVPALLGELDVPGGQAGVDAAVAFDHPVRVQVQLPGQVHHHGIVGPLLPHADDHVPGGPHLVTSGIVRGFDLGHVDTALFLRRSLAEGWAAGIRPGFPVIR